MRLTHPWPPTCDASSRVLILGAFPSPKSREQGFYYGHPQNLFWRVLPEVLGASAQDSASVAPGACKDPAELVAARRAFVLRHHIALWDVIASCEIKGAADSSIRDPKPNEFAPLLARTRITTIFTTGRTATRIFNDLAAKEAGMQAIYLPSTSPANRATQSKPEFLRAWRQVAAAASCASSPPTA